MLRSGVWWIGLAYARDSALPRGLDCPLGTFCIMSVLALGLD